MHFEGEFRVPGRPEDVIHRFADVERMASCMPGAVLDKQDEDGAWHGGLLVTFGIPPEGIGIVLGVDRILDMTRTMTNVGSDLVTTLVVDAQTREKQAAV